ncbi:hypothetical protein IOC53_07525, partial [Rathayibacter sp. SD072]|nr:hypothetical protein [Rathayibacter sp. SD072]
MTRVRRPRMRRARRPALLAALVAVVVGALAPAAAASPLAVSSPASGSVIPGGPTAVSGTGTAGNQIQVGVRGGGDPLCITTVAADDTWSCTATLADGPTVLTAVELLATGGTTTTTAQLAVLSPPVIGSVDGSATSAGSVRGTAYPGASVAVTTDGGAS